MTSVLSPIPGVTADFLLFSHVSSVNGSRGQSSLRWQHWSATMVFSPPIRQQSWSATVVFSPVIGWLHQLATVAFFMYQELSSTPSLCVPDAKVLLTTYSIGSFPQCPHHVCLKHGNRPSYSSPQSPSPAGMSSSIVNLYYRLSLSGDYTPHKL